MTDAKEECVTVTCELDEPPEQVFRALTERALLAAWLMPNDFEARVGARFTFRPEGEPPIECTVLALEPGRLVRYSWRERTRESERAPSRLESVVSFELRPAHAGGTLLRLEHRGTAARIGRLTSFTARALACACSQEATTWGDLRWAA